MYILWPFPMHHAICFSEHTGESGGLTSLLELCWPLDESHNYICHCGNNNTNISYYKVSFNWSHGLDVGWWILTRIAELYGHDKSLVKPYVAWQWVTVDCCTKCVYFTMKWTLNPTDIFILQSSHETSVQWSKIVKKILTKPKWKALWDLRLKRDWLRSLDFD